MWHIQMEINGMRTTWTSIWKTDIRDSFLNHTGQGLLYLFHSDEEVKIDIKSVVIYFPETIYMGYVVEAGEYPGARSELQHGLELEVDQ